MKETEKTKCGNTDTKWQPISHSLSWEIFMKLYFSSDSLFADIYLLIIINVPLLTSRDNDFKESRRMVFYCMICNQKISISYCDLYRVVFSVDRHVLVSFVPSTKVSANLQELG